MTATYQNFFRSALLAMTGLLLLSINPLLANPCEDSENWFGPDGSPNHIPLCHLEDQKPLTLVCLSYAGMGILLSSQYVFLGS